MNSSNGRTVPTCSHQRKQDHVADRRAVGEQHDQAIDADALAGRRRHPVSERPDVVLVHRVRFLVAAARSSCSSKRRRCSTGSFSSLKALATSKPPDVQLEPLDRVRVVRLLLRQRRDLGRKVVDERRLISSSSQSASKISAVILPAQPQRRAPSIPRRAPAWRRIARPQSAGSTVVARAAAARQRRGRRAERQPRNGGRQRDGASPKVI